ncbi:hypothetical protein LR48_Vigan01g077300 [Vigna angularis]|uniref:Uncharacterized protein n=1 Tax=Phaseolus angularis TaxID=3914 RepID=A0A0L9TKV3_PHAAN|nr:hypothetical protein LR48_Vigan01g077300 [Vigna angularis]
MIEEGSERRNKGKGVARPKKRQRQTPKYVLRVLATLPTTAAPNPSSMGPSPTPTVHPPPTPIVHPPPTPVVNPPSTPATDILPPPLIITPTPPSVIITLTAPPDPTFIPSSSCILPSETTTPSADPYSACDGDGVDPPLHDRPWIEPYGKGFIPSRVASQAITQSIKQQYLSPWPTWGVIPVDDKKPFWEHFKGSFMILGFSAIDFVSLSFLRVSSQSRASFTYPLRLISSRKARGVRIVLAQLLSSSSRALVHQVVFRARSNTLRR